MSHQVCLPSNHFIACVVACVAIIGWALYQVNQQANLINILTAKQRLSRQLDQRQLDQINGQPSPTLPPIPPVIDYDRINQMIAERLNERDQVRDRDRERASNIIVPPPAPIMQPAMLPVLPTMPMPTNYMMPEYDTFQVVGYVQQAHHRRNPNMMFPLFGRRTGSYRYEYYVIHPQNQIRIPVFNKNGWELNEDDKVKIKGFPGDFRVELYKDDAPRYVPF